MSAPESERELGARLLQKAGEAAARAYAPYSRLRVGAAVWTARGNLYCGVNVENASYGLTLCAERAAVAQAVAAEWEGMRLRAVAVADASGKALTPCGACRQVILEFGPEASVFFKAREGVKQVRAADLLPEGFLLSD